jgi:hypothetical protein
VTFRCRTRKPLKFTFIFAKTGLISKAKVISIVSFYDELTRRWPEIDTVPDEEIDNLEYCPWSCALSRSDIAVVTSCVWSMADEVEAFVRELAQRHRLVLFSPQSGSVYLPEHLKR